MFLSACACVCPVEEEGRALAAKDVRPQEEVGTQQIQCIGFFGAARVLEVDRKAEQVSC